MARPFPVAVRTAVPETLASRLERLAAPLRKLEATAVRERFAIPAEATLLKTTLSLCPACLDHVPAAVFAESGRVLIAKRCNTHGRTLALAENDERFYRLSNKDRWGRAYDLSRIHHIPEYEGASCCGEGSSCAPQPQAEWLEALTDQRGNKSCTVLVEITDACNLACRVCYADAKGDRWLPVEEFRRTLDELLAMKGTLDSVQVTGGEAVLHPRFWEVLDDLHARAGVKKIYLPTNGLAFDRPGIAERLVPYRDKLLVLLQFDGGDATANRALRRARPARVRESLIGRLERLGLPMQLTMTIAPGVNEGDIAWVVRQGARHRHVRLVALQPAFYSGRYELPTDPLRRATMSDAIKGVVAGLGRRARLEDFMPIPCSHPNCGWVTLFVRRFGFFHNLVQHLDAAQATSKYAYRTQLGGEEVRGLVEPARGTIRAGLARLARRLIEPRHVFGIAIKPFMDRYTYDQDRISNCCHHIVDTRGRLASFCEYNALHRAGDSWAARPKIERHVQPVDSAA